MIPDKPYQGQITYKPSRTIKWLLGLLFFTIVTTAAMSTWVLTTTTGLQWLLSAASRVSSGSIVFNGISGTFNTLHTESVRFSNKDIQITVRDFTLDWQPKKLFSGQIKIQKLSARDIAVLSLTTNNKEPSSPLEKPENLQLPVSISIDHVTIAILRVFFKNTDAPDTPNMSATNITTRFHSNGQHHVLSNFKVNSDFGSLNASARLDGKEPFAISSKINFSGLTNLTNKQMPATHIQAQIFGNLDQFNIDIAANGSLIQGTGSATLHPFSLLPVSEISISTRGLNLQNILPEKPETNISLSTKFRESESETQTLVGHIALKNQHVQALNYGGLPLHGVSANLTLSPNLLEFEDLSLLLPDNGTISGNLSWRPAQSAGTAALTVNQLNPLALDTRLQAARINGNITLDGDTKIQRGIIKLKDKTLSLKTNILHTEKIITLDKLQLNRHQSALSGQGTLHLNKQQLFEFRGKLTRFNLADFIQSPDSELNLSLRLKGNLSPQPTGSAKFNFENSLLAKRPVSGGGTIGLGASNQLNSDIDLNIGVNSLLIAGKFGKPGDQMKLKISAPELAQLGTNIKGALNLNANLAGSFASPSARFDISGNNLMIADDYNLHEITARGNFHKKKISFILNAANFRNQDKTQIQHFIVSVSGHKSHHEFNVKAQKNDEIAINLLAKGGLVTPSQHGPSIRWRGKILKLSATGPLPFHLDTAAKLELGPKHFFLEKTGLTMAKGKLDITRVLWTPKQWHTEGKFTGISLRSDELTEQNQQILQLGGKWNITSSNNTNSTLQIERERGDWVLPGDFPLALGLKELQLSAKIAEKKLSGKFSVQGEHVGKSNAHFSIPLTSSSTNNWKVLPGAPITGQLSANISDISWIGKILDDNYNSGGKLGLQAKLSGTIEKPGLRGQVNGENLAFSLLDQGLRLEQGRLDAHFDQAALHIDSLKFSAPNKTPPDDRLLTNFKFNQAPGDLAISGKIGLAGNGTNLKAKLNRISLAHETNYWILASGRVNTGFINNTFTISGKISADAGLIAQPPAGRPQLAGDIVIGKKSTENPDKMTSNLNVKLDLGKDFYIRASGLTGRLDGQLHLNSTERNKLNTSGSITARNAIFEAYGHKLSVERGIVNFNGPLDDPGLNILAIRKNLPIGTGNFSGATNSSSQSRSLPVKAGIEVLGTVRQPRIRLVSTPSVPDSEKLSWIVFGRPLGSGVDSSLLLTAAGSILGDQAGGSSITKKLRQTLDIDEISFRQSNTGTDPLASQIGTIGKRLSSRAYVSYERGLTTASVGVTKLSYTLTPRITVVSQAGFDNALDVFYTFQFD